MKLHNPLNPATGLEDASQLPWSDGIPQSGQEGSFPPSAMCVETMDEIVNAITQAGIVPASSDLFQLTRAIRGGQLDFDATDIGTADAVICQIGLAHTAITAGLPFTFIKGPAANTGNAVPTLTITDLSGNNGLTGTIVKAGGGALKAGDLPANALITVRARAPGVFAVVSLLTLSDVQAATLFYGPDTSTTANTVTVAMPAFGAGPTTGRPFEVKIANTLTGASQINVNGSGLKTITRGDGSPTQAGDLVVGQDAQFVFDGTNVQIQGLLSSALPPRGRWFRNTPGTYTFTVPAGVTQIYGRLWGGGGGGGGSNAATAAGGGGAAGGYAEGWIALPPGTTSITVVVAAGGAAGNATANGGTGLTSSIGSFMTTTGGTGGGSSNGQPGSQGGAGSGGQFNFTGGGGGTGNYVGSSTSNVYGGFGAPSYGQSVIPSPLTAGGNISAFGPGSGGSGGCGGTGPGINGGTGGNGTADIQY